MTPLITKMIPLPLISKFNSNSVLYDALGETINNYISLTYNKNYIYFLKDTSGTVIRYNTVTEELSSLNANVIEDVYSVIEYKDDVYGFGGYDVKRFVEDSVLYIKDNNQLVQESFDRLIKVVHLSSSSEIRDFMVDENNNYYVIHNKNKISKFTKDRILVYSTAITPSVSSIFNSLGVMPNDEIGLFKIDFVKEYTMDGYKSYPIILGRIKNGTADLSSGVMFLGKFDETTQSVISATFIPLTAEYYSFGDYNKINYNLTNYDYLKNTYSDTNSLTFKVVLQNVYNNKDKISVSIPLNIEYYKSESHHFAFRLDGINGKISAFVDGKEISTVSIPNGQYIFQDIFSETATIGKTYFHNNITLDKYLNQKNYYIDNAVVKQFKFYKKALTNNEIDFLVYKGIGMDDLIVSLPCDQRNEIDSIERQFKLDTSGNKSNNVNIIIKNSQITNTVLQNQLKSVISDKLKKVLPLTTKINDITFR